MPIGFRSPTDTSYFSDPDYPPTAGDDWLDAACEDPDDEIDFDF